jgi:hypothetical protein
MRVGERQRVDDDDEIQDRNLRRKGFDLRPHQIGLVGLDVKQRAQLGDGGPHRWDFYRHCTHRAFENEIRAAALGSRGAAGRRLLFAERPNGTRRHEIAARSVWPADDLGEETLRNWPGNTLISAWRRRRRRLFDGAREGVRGRAAGISDESASPSDKVFLKNDIRVKKRARCGFAAAAGGAGLVHIVHARKISIKFPISIRESRNAFPSFFDLNPLKSHEPPKEMLGKSLEEIWRARKLLCDFNALREGRRVAGVSSKGFRKCPASARSPSLTGGGN